MIRFVRTIPPRFSAPAFCVPFMDTVAKYLGAEGPCGSHGPSWWESVVGGTWDIDHMVSAIRKLRERSAGVQSPVSFFLFFIQSGPPAHGMVPPVLMVCHSCSGQTV